MSIETLYGVMQASIALFECRAEVTVMQAASMALLHHSQVTGRRRSLAMAPRRQARSRRTARTRTGALLPQVRPLMLSLILCSRSRRGPASRSCARSFPPIGYVSGGEHQADEFP